MESQSLVVQLQGEAPYGFRLIGGENSPLIVSKIRPYSKSQQGGLLEGDVVLAINGVSTRGLTHATSTGLTECNAQKLALHVLRGKSSKQEYQTALSQLGEQVRSLSDSEASKLISTAPARSYTPSTNGGGGGDVPFEGFNSLVINGDSDSPFQLQMPPSGGLKQMRNFRRESMERSDNTSLPVIRVSEVGEDVHDGHLQGRGVSTLGTNQQPGYYSREEHTFDEGDTKRRTVQEVSTEKVGGTTVTKVVKQEFSNRQTSVQIPVQFSSQPTYAINAAPQLQAYNNDTEQQQRQQYGGYSQAATAPIKVQWDTDSGPQRTNGGQVLHGVSVNTRYNNTEAPVRVQTYNQQTNSWESGGHQAAAQPQRINTNTTWDSNVMPKILQDLNDSTSWTRTGYNDNSRANDQPYTTQNVTSNDWYNTSSAEKDVKVDVRPGGEIQIQFQSNVNQYNPPQSYIDVQRSYQPQASQQSQDYTVDWKECQQNDGGNTYSTGNIQYPYRPGGNTTTQYGGAPLGMPIIRAECSSGDLPHISFSVQPPARSQHSYTMTREEPLVTYYQTTSQLPPETSRQDTSSYEPFETDIIESRQTKRIVETTNNVIEHAPVTVRTGFTVSTVAAQSPKIPASSWGGANAGLSHGQLSAVQVTEQENDSQFGQTRDGWNTAPVSVLQQPSLPQTTPQRSTSATVVTGQYPWATKEPADNSRQNYSSSSSQAQKIFGTGSRILRPLNSQEEEGRNNANLSSNSVGNQKPASTLPPNLPPWAQSTEQGNRQVHGNYPSQEPGIQSYQQGNSPRSPPATAGYQSVQSGKQFAESRDNQPNLLQRYPSNQGTLPRANQEVTSPPTYQEVTSPRTYQEAPFQRQQSNKVTSYRDYQDTPSQGYQNPSSYPYQSSAVEDNRPSQNYQGNPSQGYSVTSPKAYSNNPEYPAQSNQSNPLQTYSANQPQTYQNNLPQTHQPTSPNAYQQTNPNNYQNSPQNYQDNPQNYQNNSFTNQQSTPQFNPVSSPQAYQANSMPGYQQQQPLQGYQRNTGPTSPQSYQVVSPQAYQSPSDMGPGRQIWQPPGSASTQPAQQPPMFNAQNSYQDADNNGYQNSYPAMMPSTAAPPPAPPLGLQMNGKCPPMAPPPPPVEAPSNKNVYGPSAVKEGVKIAKSVALSVMSPQNDNSRGQSMFLRRQQNSEKWTTAGSEGTDNYQQSNYGHNSGGASQNTWSANSSPALSRSVNQQQSFPGQATKRNSFPGSQSPVPFGPGGLSDDMAKNMGKGGQLFAKRKERAEKWNAADNAAGANTNRPCVVGSAINRQTSLPGMEGAYRPPLNMTVVSGGNRQSVGSVKAPPGGQYGYGGAAVNKSGYTDL